MDALEDGEDVAKAISFRHYLHEHPALSFAEAPTVNLIEAFLVQNGIEPQQCHRLCDGRALVVTFDSLSRKTNIVIRGDIDALPIDELAAFRPYSSKVPGVSHKACTNFLGS